MPAGHYSVIITTFAISNMPSLILPLTTIWTPPCSSIVQFSHYSIATCAPPECKEIRGPTFLQAFCSPRTGYATRLLALIGESLLTPDVIDISVWYNGGYYSPGICFSGYTSGCVPTSGYFQSGETAALCVPRYAAQCLLIFSPFPVPRED